MKVILCIITVRKMGGQTGQWSQSKYLFKCFAYMGLFNKIDSAPTQVYPSSKQIQGIEDYMTN
jgi:hypothetical protein